MDKNGKDTFLLVEWSNFSAKVCFLLVVKMKPEVLLQYFRIVVA